MPIYHQSTRYDPAKPVRQIHVYTQQSRLVLKGWRIQQIMPKSDSPKDLIWARSKGHPWGKQSDQSISPLQLHIDFRSWDMNKIPRVYVGVQDIHSNYSLLSGCLYVTVMCDVSGSCIPCIFISYSVSLFTENSTQMSYMRLVSTAAAWRHATPSRDPDQSRDAWDFLGVLAASANAA